MAAITAKTDVNRISKAYVAWESITVGTSDTANWVDFSEYQDKTFHWWYASGSGTTVALHGSNDPRCVTDPSNAAYQIVSRASDGTDITGSSADGGAVLDGYRWMRPVASSGTGVINFTIEAVKGYIHGV